jgi:hypothetical protein
MADKITEIVGQEAFDQVEKLKDNLSLLIDKFEKSAKVALLLNSALANVKGITDTTRVIKDQQNALSEIQKLQEKIAKQATYKAKVEAELRLELQKSKQENKDYVKSQQAKENSINSLRLQLKGLQNEYDAMSSAERESARGTDLIKHLRDVDAELKKLEAGSGRFQRNVGNYASGWSPLSSAIGQITRELPNFGQSLQIGVMSLTNNIGALQDAIKGINEQNKVLKSEGKTTTSAFSQIASALFSWNTVLYVGIGVLSAYSKEIFGFIGDLFKSEEELNKLSETQKELNKAFEDGLKNGAKEIVQLKQLYSIATDNTISINERKNAVNELQEQYPEYFANIEDEKILLGEATEAYSILSRAIINNAISKGFLAGADKISEKIVSLTMMMDVLREKASSDINLGMGKDKYDKNTFVYSKKDILESQEQLKEFKKTLEGMPGISESLKRRIEANGYDIRGLMQIIGDELTASDLEMKKYIDRSNEYKTTIKSTKDLKTPKAKAEPKASTEKKGAEVDRIAELKKQYEREQKELEISYRDRDMTEEEFYTKSIAKTSEYFKKREGLSKKETETQTDFNLQLQKIAQDYADKLKGIDDKIYNNNYKLMKDMNENSVESAKYVMENEKSSLEEKLKANTNYFTAKTDLLDLDEAKEIKSAEGNLISISAIQLKYQNARLHQFDIFNNKKNEIIQSNADKETKIELAKFDKLKEQYDNYTLETLRQLDDAYSKGLISTEEYQKKRNYYAIIGNQNSLNAQLDYTQNLLKSEKITGARRVELEKQVTALRNAIAKGNAETTTAILETEDEKIKRQVNQFNEYQKGIYDLASAITSILVDSANRDADKRIENIDRVEKAELDSLDRLSLSAKEKEEQRLKIEIDAENRRKQINNDRITRLRKLAQIQKALDVMNIITGTAAAVVNALGAKPFTPLNIAVASGIAITGSAQLAKAIATPLPQYAKGIESTPSDSFAIVGEKGTELITEKSGKQYLTPNTDTLTYLPKGTKVTPHHELMANVYDNAHKYMASNSSVTTDTMQTALIQSFEELYNKVDNLTEIMAKKNMNVSIFGDYEHAMRIKKSRM